jgi:hypothetical protein
LSVVRRKLSGPGAFPRGRAPAIVRGRWKISSLGARLAVVALSASPTIIDEPTPTPVPTSSVEPSEKPHSKTRELMRRAFEGMDVAGLIEAGERYGDDAARELADIEAGRHPLQLRMRERDADDLRSR